MRMTSKLVILVIRNR